MSYKLKIWDLPIRLFHWSLALLIIFLWYSAKISTDLMEWHAIAGKVLFALILFRLIWGIVGSETAQFSKFIKPPLTTIAYLRSMKKSDNEPIIGHTPPGAYMIITMLLVILIQIVSGLCSSDDIFVEGNFYRYLDHETAEWMASIHYYTFYILIFLISLHVSTIAIYAITGVNMVKPMISGSKIVQEKKIPPKLISTWKAFFIFLVVFVLTFLFLK